MALEEETALASEVDLALKVRNSHARSLSPRVEGGGRDVEAVNRAATGMLAGP